MKYFWVGVWTLAILIVEDMKAEIQGCEAPQFKSGNLLRERNTTGK